MKKILILTLLISFIGIDIQAQSWQQVFGRQRFNAGIGIPVRDTLSPNAADSAQIVIRPQDGILYYRYKGAWIRASAQDTSNFVTVAGAAQTITSEKTFRTPLNVIAGASGGATITFNSTANGGNKWHIGAWSNVNDLPRSFGFYNELSGKTPLVIDTQRLQFINPFQITWTVEDLGYADSGYPNAGMAWDSLNRLQVNNGTAGSYADLKLRSLISTDLSGTGTRIVYADNNGKLSASGTLTGYLLKADSLSGGYTSWLLTKKKVDSLGAVKLNISDSATYYDKVVRTFGTQTIGGNKTFTNDIFASTARIGIGAGGNTSNSVLGYNVFTSNTTGTKNTAMGENSLSSNVSATDNTAFGWYSLDAATGSGNTGIGSGALGTNTSGSNNTALGFGAGEYVTGTNPNSTGTNSIYIGFNTKASANGETNQTVIGHNLTGNGSNTVTIGNSSVTGNYFNGFLKQTSVTSNVLKADGTGQLVAAVAGTDYVVPSALSGYVDLTTTQNIGGSKTFTNRLFGGSLSINNTGTFARFQLNGVDGQALAYLYNNSGTAGNVQGVIIEAGTNTSDYSLDVKSSTGTSYLRVRGDGQTTLGGALNGTSLSMSGAGSFGGNVGIGTASPSYDLTIQKSQATAYASSSGAAVEPSGGVNATITNTANGGFSSLRFVSLNSSNAFGYLGFLNNTGSVGGAFVFGQRTGGNSYAEQARLENDGALLINTTTTDGTNKLIVNGGVKSNNNITAVGDLVTENGNGLTFTQLRNTSTGGNIYTLASAGASNPHSESAGTFYIRNSTNNSTPFKIASTGAATFSSSVTATSGTFSDELYTATNLRVRGYNISGDFGPGYSISTGIGASGAAGRGINIGWNTTNDIGFIGTVHNGQAWKSLALVPLAGNLIVGSITDDGANKLQVNGSVSATNMSLSGTRPALSVRNGSSSFGRFTAVVDDWVGMTQNMMYNGSAWNLDNTGLIGLVLKLDVRTGLERMSLFSATAGSNPRTESEVFYVTKSGAATFSSTITAGEITSNTTNGSFFLRNAGGVAGNNAVELNIRPNAGKSGYLTFTENAVADRWSVGIANGNSDLRFIPNFVTSSPVLTLSNAGAAIFSSSVTATGFFESSDLRLKNIVKRDGDVVYFNWKNGQDKNLHIGYIAQEVQKTNPDQVKADEKGMLSVNYTEVLVQKVRELEKQIAELQNRIK